MTISELISEFGLEVFALAKNQNASVVSGYTSDLLSDVMAHAQENDVWITTQTHGNIVAVAALRDLAAVILVNDLEPQENTVRHSDDENIPVLGTNLSTFDIAGKLYQLFNQ